MDNDDRPDPRPNPRAFLTGTEDKAIFLDAVGDYLADLPDDHTLVLMALKIDQLGELAVARGDATVELVSMEATSRLNHRLSDLHVVVWSNEDLFVIASVVRDSATQIEALHRRAFACFDDPFLLANSRLYLTASIGVAFSSGTDDGPQELLGSAEAAQAIARRAGERQIVVFDRAARSAVRDEFEMAQELHRAQARNELHLSYQRIIELSGRSTVGFDTRVLWTRHGQELVPAESFIPLARRSGLVVSIGHWILGQVTADWAQQSTTGSGDAAPTVSVQASLLTSGLNHLGNNLVEAAGRLPGKLQIEITEQCLTSDEGGITATLNWLKSSGVEVIVGKFGTSNSSLECLRKYPVDGIKIDQAFIDRIHTNERDQAMVGVLIDLAHRLGVTAMADGVCSDEQLEVLASLSCDLAQGCFIGPPLPIDQITRKRNDR
jgi:EAL domain-containing protein (putative c-di-GMP-specific phosphodiesterase class I)/GGDEF domain-containing protein